MRFMMMMKSTRESEAGQPPDARLMATIARHSQEMARAGVLLVSEGLAPSREGARITTSGGKLAVIDGPFAETAELIAGFAIIEAASREEALEHGRRFMALHLDALGPDCRYTCEVRRVVGPDEFCVA